MWNKIWKWLQFKRACDNLQGEVIIEIHSGVPNVIKKSQGIKLIIKDFETQYSIGDLYKDGNGEYILNEWCADSKV